MATTLVVQFWVVAVLLAMTPGADWAYAIAAGIRARTVVPSVSGMLAGYAVVITIVALGVGTFMARYPIALTVLTVAGAAYLVWLGITTLTGPVAHLTAGDEPIDGGPIAQFLRGAGVSGINPKGLLLLLALLPQFTRADGWPSPVQMMLLGSLHLINCCVIYFTVAHLARGLLRSRPRATLIVTRLSGTAMTLIGIGLIAERVLPGI